MDDHPVVRDGLRGIFTGDPEFEVVGEAGDGAEAVDLAETLRPDVVLMDLRMPGVNGAAAIRRLAERGNPARVLVLTTYETDADVVPALEAGATGYLLKDAPRADLVNAVRAAHRGESVLAPSVAVAAGQPAPAPGPGRVERPRAGGAGADRPGRDEPRHRGPPVHLRGDGQDPSAPHLRQARRERPRRGRRDGVRTRSAGARSGLTRLRGRRMVVVVRSDAMRRGTGDVRCSCRWSGRVGSGRSRRSRRSRPWRSWPWRRAGEPARSRPARGRRRRPGVVASGGAIGSTVVAGDDLCKLLGPGDLTAAGVSGAGGPTENNQPPDAWFCVYRGESSATGGIELDVFLSDSATAAHDVFPDLFGEYLAADVKTVSIAGADEARMLLPTSDGSTDPALIGARKGRLTIGLGVGTAFADAEKTGEAIRQLAVLVLQRAGTLGD